MDTNKSSFRSLFKCKNLGGYEKKFRNDPFAVGDTGRVIKDFNQSEWDNPEWGGQGRRAEPLRLTLNKKRADILFLFACVVFAFIFLRIFSFQVSHGEHYRGIAEGNRLRRQNLPAPRGGIKDRNGKELVRNVPSFQLHLKPQNIQRENLFDMAVLEKLSQILGYDINEMDKKLRQTIESQDEVVIFSDNLSNTQAIKLILLTKDMQGLQVEYVPSRYYPEKDYLAHVVGYTGPISSEEYVKLKPAGYYFNSLIGRVGLEAFYEDFLRGKDGVREIEIDSKGRVIKVVGERRAVPGQNLDLSLDLVLQKTATRALEAALSRSHSRAGGAVVLDIQDGSILAFVSLPSFDPNIFTQARDPSDRQALERVFEDPAKPLFNRTIGGLYPPGSTIKTAIALRALDQGIITDSTKILSTGGISVGEWFFPDWKAGGHGLVNVKKAVAESVNTFFYTIGGGYKDFKGLGVKSIVQGLSESGFGEKTGVDLIGESSGFLPTPEWKKAARGEPWYIGDTYHLSIGQGDILVTPLQIAYLTALIGSNGKIPAPHLVKDKKNSNIEMTADERNFQIIRDGMRMAVTSGSARALFNHPMDIAGKTGTAQADNNKKSHAWFTSFAPYQNPKYAVTVFIENGGEGSTFAVPAAKEIYDEIYRFEN